MTRAKRPWPAGAATAIGSLPGTDPAEALRLVLGELPDLAHLPELPDRGPGADMVGRGACLLTDLPVEIAPSGWRLSAHAGRDLRRAHDFLERDLDTLEQLAVGVTGALKVQLVGPWTLAASLELPSGHRVVSDYGATRDLAESLADGLRTHLAELARRLPAATIVVQVDEPSLPAVLNARVPTPSGFGTVRGVDTTLVEQTLRDVLDVVPVGARVVHCCAADVPIQLLRDAGADALSVDLSQLSGAKLDALGESIEAGLSLWLGVLPALDATITLDQAREPVQLLWRALGFPAGQLAETVVPTPTCGLAGASSAYVRRVLAVLRDTGQSLLEEPG
jgi:methionine synthase II (cobalamin-independent)